MELIIGGDLFLGNQIERIAIENPDKIWGDSLDVLKSSDMRIVNLESPLTYSDEKIVKTGPHLKASPKTINSIKYAGIDLVTLANNHILDYGNKGIIDTLNLCKENNIDYVGAGRNIEEARKTYFKELGGSKLAVVNFAENEWSSATEMNGGSNPMDIVNNIRQIKEAKKNSDFVLVIVHGGHELYPYPSPRMVKAYRFYVENGASAVIGHHTHCTSGYEVYQGSPIFYSIGNLVFPSTIKFDGWYEGVFIKLIFKNQIKFEIIPYYQFNNNEVGIRLMNKKSKELFLDKMASISDVIKSREQLNYRWENYLSKLAEGRKLQLSGKTSLHYRILNKIGVVDLFLSKKKMILLLNLIRCEAHKDISIGTLEKFISNE